MTKGNLNQLKVAVKLALKDYGVKGLTEKPKAIVEHVANSKGETRELIADWLRNNEISPATSIARRAADLWAELKKKQG